MTTGDLHHKQPIQDMPGANDTGNNTSKKLPSLSSLRGSQMVKIVMIGILMLLLQVPISKIDDVISERQMRSNEAASEIATKWGRQQNIVGPIITVPFERKTVVQEKNNESGVVGNREVIVHEQAHFLAEELCIEAQTDTTVRHRGIFERPVYRAGVTLSGRFNKPDFSRLDVEPSRIFWERATLTVLIADPRTISNQATLSWNEQPLAFQPGTNEILGSGQGIQVSLKDHLQEESFSFSCQLNLQGSGGLFFAPMGGTTKADITSNWPHPSFQGDWLPIEHDIDGKSFRANWQITALGRQHGQQWVGRSRINDMIGSALFGVNFVQPIDTYRMAERSVKYQFLFLALTFLSLWLVEVLAKIRLHPVQYLLVGSGMCLFYLLELSLAEHLGFIIAYCLAASAVVLLLSCYCLSILRSGKRSIIIGGFITFLYAYLYTLLINQDYALLAGSLGLFVLLAVVMYLTRNIDWSVRRG
ncbi:cell envelope integrity protein CreD [uncultured Vibrio sp.]|uniref:cell envelope integrity protein CreD n=1 Tax=uncultured Vibrio sp. TaxID=114054 RepID=UPI002AA762B6|nr:cell envelope integrity protein CreD [uncultured Vibrio sp.]